MRLAILFWIGLNIGVPATYGGVGDALDKGKWLLNLRFRLEFVEQDGLNKDAWAPTLRTRLGYQTAPLMGWKALLEFENVTVTGETLFNDTINGARSRPVVADPEDTEVNRIQLVYHVGIHEIRLGRQRLILDNARFIGNVGWRQNEQTFDAVVWRLSVLKKANLTLAYLANANRIFGAHHPTASDSRLNSVLSHLEIAQLPIGTLSLFGYFLDFDNAPAMAHKNLGVRLKGAIKINDRLQFHHDLSYVDQSSYKDGEERNEAGYFFLGWGPQWHAVRLQFNYELLEGDGRYGFSTPLATLHAFNGWVDRFLTTPTTGLRDIFISLGYEAKGWKALLFAHQFDSDSGGIPYGKEWDLLLTKKLTPRALAGLKLATYHADQFAVDTTKIWGYFQFNW